MAIDTNGLIKYFSAIGMEAEYERGTLVKFGDKRVVFCDDEIYQIGELIVTYLGNYYKKSAIYP